MYEYKYKIITLNEILNLLKKGSVVSVISEHPDNYIDEPVYMASEIGSEHSFVEVDELVHLNPQKELNDLQNIIRSSLLSKKNRIGKIYYVKVSLYSDPLLTLSYE